MMQNNFMLLVLIFKPVLKRRGDTHKPDRKAVLTFNISQQYLRILLTRFRERMPDLYSNLGRISSNYTIMPLFAKFAQVRPKS